MNNAQQTARVGLFFLLGVALIWVAFETLSSGHFFGSSQGYTVVADFGSLKDLKNGDEVRMAGVPIGSVAQARLADQRGAEAVLRINQGVKIANDAVATIAMSGIIGVDHIDIALGTPGAPPIPEGGHIRTRETPDLNSVMSELGDLGQKIEAALGTFQQAIGGNGQPGGGLFQKLDQLVTDNTTRIDTTLANLQDITTKVDRGQGTIGRLINDPRLHDDLLAAVDQLKTAGTQANAMIADAQGIIEHVKAGQGTVGVLLYDQKTADGLKATVENIRSVSDKLASGQGTLGRLINDDSMYITAQGALKKADRALDTLNDTGPITAVGIVANALF